jgi:hypothetical protein
MNNTKEKAQRLFASSQVAFDLNHSGHWEVWGTEDRNQKGDPERRHFLSNTTRPNSDDVPFRRMLKSEDRELC